MFFINVCEEIFGIFRYENFFVYFHFSTEIFSVCGQTRICSEAGEIHYLDSVSLDLVKNQRAVLRIRDPVPFWPRDPEWVKNQDPDPG
jgi:hypothetical protein